MAVTADARPVIAVVAIAALVGFIASKIVEPDYLARATLWVEKGNAAERTMWARMVDSAVRNDGLFLIPARDADLALFRDLRLRERFMPGAYTLAVDAVGAKWQLEVADIYQTDSGSVGDSVGRRFGLNWLPPASALARHAGGVQHFDIETPRNAAATIMRNLTAVHPPRSRFVSLALIDESPARAARALNAIAARYIQGAHARGEGPVILLDSAVAPGSPARNSPSQLIGRAVLIGAAIGLCLILVQIVRGNNVLAVPELQQQTENRSVFTP